MPPTIPTGAPEHRSAPKASPRCRPFLADQAPRRSEQGPDAAKDPDDVRIGVFADHPRGTLGLRAHRTKRGVSDGYALMNGARTQCAAVGPVTRSTSP